MGKNNEKEIAEALLAAKKVWIFPHKNPDGDGLGSAAALCHSLRLLGKDAVILMEDSIPLNLRFLDSGCFLSFEEAEGEPDVSVAVDCGDEKRFEKRKALYDMGKLKLNVDHHGSNPYYGDLNWVEPDAAACGEIIFDLIGRMGLAPDEESGQALYAALITDTGNFQHSCTTKRSFRIAGELLDSGLDRERVCIEIYQKQRPQKLKLEALALSAMELRFGGRLAMTTVTQKMLTEADALMEESEGIVDRLKSIDGVEVACLLKETEEKLIRISMRSKSFVDVAAIAAGIGGGGHVRAAGATLCMSYKDAEEKLASLFEGAF